jgi:hypothetical protein
MKEAVDIMMHTKFPDVNNALFLWRDEHNLLHASRPGNRYRTLCGEISSDMAYAGRTYEGRTEAPTCLACVAAP